jgi:tetratricopeptide (TPR) repeat protein
MTRHIQGCSCRIHHWIYLPALLLALLLAHPARAGDSLLNRVTLSQLPASQKHPEQQRIEVQLRSGARTTGSQPLQQGTRLLINLGATTATPDPFWMRPQEIRFHATDKAPLVSLDYQPGMSGTGLLTLTFNQAVEHQLLPGSASDRLVILVSSTRQTSEPVTASNDIEKAASDLMQQAKTALIDDRDFSHAADLYQRVLSLPANSQSANALEYLGLSQERQGQHRQAIQTYQRYLQHYSDSSARERVEQRLASLESIFAATPQPLKQQQDPETPGWEMVGGVSQFLYQDRYQVSGVADTRSISSLASNLDLQLLHQTDANDSRLRLSGSDYRRLDNEPKTRQRLGYLYLEHHNSDLGWWGKAGRQTSQHDGTLGRYDGLRLGYSALDTLDIGLVAGYPVQSSSEGLNSARQFAGVSAEWHPQDSDLELSAYWLEQHAGSLIDRRAIGTELRWFHSGLNLLGSLDYDLFHQRLNIGMLLLDWSITDNSSLHASLDIRQQPAMTTTNAIIGQYGSNWQTIDRPEQLGSTYSNQEIYQLARDRTAQNQTYSLGWSQRLNNSLNWSTDVTMSQTSATKASANVTAIAATGQQWSTSSQLTLLDFPGQGDVTLTGLRYSNTATVDSKGLFANSRIRSGQHWRWTPSLLLDQRQWLTSDRQQQRLAPSLSLGYQTGAALLEAELGLEWLNSQSSSGDDNSQSIFMGIGYQYDF